MTDNTLFGITIDKHISIGHIITTIVIGATGVMAYANMINRIYNLEQANVRTERTLEMMRNDYQRTVDKIYFKLEKIEDKIDQKADKVGK